MPAIRIVTMTLHDQARSDEKPADQVIWRQFKSGFMCKLPSRSLLRISGDCVASGITIALPTR